MSGAIPVRRLIALLIFAASLALWWTESDVIKLIIKQDEVLFGRYSQGHFGALLVLTPLLWGLAAAVWSPQPLARALGNFGLGTVSTLVAILLLVYLSSIVARPARYVELDAANNERARELQLAGVVRHRPPNERYELTYSDRPEHPRSYPDAPAGYGDVDIVLTSDQNGFRNFEPREQYDLIVVGDSFAAGSHVSDDQGWAELLRRETGRSLYNLGVSGSGPRSYLNNFVYFGLDLQPRQALLMLYEGNDFKEDVMLAATGGQQTAAQQVAPTQQKTRMERLDEHLSTAFKSSPVTAGLRQLSKSIFEPANADRPVPGYAEQLGFMPVRIDHQGQPQYYSFQPKRLIRLYEDQQEFAASEVWSATRAVLEEFAARCIELGIEPMLVYAPSKPHVVMPLVEDAVPAQQLWNFARYGRSSLPEPDVFKRELYQRLDSQVNVVMDWCEQRGLRCLNLTPALTEASGNGIQTYFTYDQHWTPDGNRVVADAIETFLSPHPDS